MPKICLIYNMAQHYRREIFLLIDKAFNCRFVFGKNPIGVTDIKSIAESEFKDATLVENMVFCKAPFYWQKGVFRELFNGAGCYIMLGEPFCVSTWIFASIIKIIPQKKLYFWSHGWYGHENFIKRVLKKIFFRLSSGVFVYGNYARNLMIKEGFNEKKIFVIYNSLAYSKQIEIRYRLFENDVFKSHFHNNNKNIIFIGRLGANKKLNMIIEALATLKKSGVMMNATFIGDGSERENLQKLAENIGVTENVWFYGACYDENENANLIYNADMCVSPGNVGLTAMHALVFGCPVITHDNFSMQMPEFESVKAGVTGAYFKYGSIESLVEAICQWDAKSFDRDKIRKNCFDEIDSKWNPQHQLEILKNVLGV